MRKLERKRTKGIPLAFRNEKRISKMLKLLKAERKLQCGEIEKHEFPSNWSSCKKQLQKESADKCAYCESITSVIAYGDVEHYRPKSVYWWLAYCYDNYLASCTLCNQKYKKAKFKVLNARLASPRVNRGNTDAQLKRKAPKATPDPYTESEGMPWAQYESAHHAERPLLLNPYIDDPAKYFAWKVDHSECANII